MNERDSGKPATHPRLGVDESGPVGGEMLESGLDIGDGECDVVQTFTVLGHEFPHRGFRSQWLEQLDEGPPYGDHRLLDSLLRDGLPIERLHPIAISVVVDGGIQVGNGDRDVVEIQQFHLVEGIRPRGSWHHIAGSISHQEVL